jgi:hypothetical protein
VKKLSSTVLIVLSALVAKFTALSINENPKNSSDQLTVRLLANVDWRGLKLEEWKKVLKKMLAYCALDTWAMVRILGEMAKATKNGGKVNSCVRVVENLIQQ